MARFTLTRGQVYSRSIVLLIWPNRYQQRRALRAAADAERWAPKQYRAIDIVYLQGYSAQMVEIQKTETYLQWIDALQDVKGARTDIGADRAAGGGKSR